MFFILGAVIGSFINATVYRLQRKQDFVKERSVCEQCKHVLAWYDLVPILSWLSLRGKCRYCHKSISWIHPSVELALASTFLVSWLYWPLQLSQNIEYLQFGLWLAIVSVLMALLIYDIQTMILPNSILLPLAVLVGLSLIIGLIDSSDRAEFAKQLLVGSFIGGGIFYILFQLSAGRWIGGGDVKMGLIMGAYLGIMDSFLALMMAFYISAAYVIPLMAIKRLHRKSKVPFGPFLIIGYFIAGLWGGEIGDWLQNWLGL